MADRAAGAALFADISGFTSLTELLAIEAGPQRGAEELASILNTLFERIIDDLRRYGGEVLYFSGDAVTCWIDGDDGSRAAACALEIQSTMRDIGRFETDSGRSVVLSIKVAVAVGPVRRFLVGDPAIQYIDVLAGELVDHLASAEQLAEKGDVILDQSAVDSLGDRVLIGDTRVNRDTGRTCGVVEELLVEVAGIEPDVQLDAIDEDETRRWLLPTIYERLTTGGGEFLAELRVAYPMFVRFAGIDYDEDPEAEAKLDAFIRRSQQILDGYGGNVLQLTVGDKGAYLYATFGSPRTHEDDAARAVSAALELSQLGVTTAVHGLQIGISGGRVFSGTYGHPMRRTFTCLGDAVNLSARLMSKAGDGEVLVSDAVVSAAGEGFEWETLESLTLKGKAKPVVAHRLVNAQTPTAARRQRYPLPMVGRDAEATEIIALLEQAMAGSRRVVGITAEAGLGKSRLLADLTRTMTTRGRFVGFGAAQAFGRNMGYLVWREVWQSIFGLSNVAESDQVAAVETKLRSIDPLLALRAPLLSGVLGLDIPDNDVTSQFDAKLRKTSLENLLADTLRAELAERHIVIVLEDCQWIDDASVDILDVLVRESAGLPLFVMLTYRPDMDAETRNRILELPSFREIPLGELGRGDIEQIALSKLIQQFGTHVVPSPEVIAVIVERGEGNPFYVEELVNLFRRSGVDVSDSATLAELELPDSLRALVLSRVDTLDEGPRRTAKVASVVGREFDEPTLPGVFPELGTSEIISALLAVLSDADLVLQDRQFDRSWLFRHAMTRDVAYEGIPFAIRASLHEATGDYIAGADGAIELKLDLLAHHYWHSNNQEKKVEFLRRAGEGAKARYANDAAIDYFERLAPIVPEVDRSAVLLQLGEVLELVGDWARAEEIETEALRLARLQGDTRSAGWCEAALAEVARKQGRFDEATALLEQALRAFEDQGDDAGRGRVLHLAGTVAAQHGDLAGAQRKYEESLRLRQRLGDQSGEASLLSNMGVVAEYGGDLDRSRDFHEKALAVRTTLGDRWAIAVSKTNLGMVAVLQARFGEARELFHEAMRLNREVGDSWMVAISHNNLGNANRGLGDFGTARRHYGDAAETYRINGDRWAAAFLFEDIAVLAATEGDAAAALELLGAADRLRDEIDAPRAAALEDELHQLVDEADHGLMDESRDAIRGRGREREFDAALAAAIEFCSS